MEVQTANAGQRTAILYSLAISRQRRGIDPHLYLSNVLSRLPSMTNRDDLDPLLPSQWKAPA